MNMDTNARKILKRIGALTDGGDVIEHKLRDPCHWLGDYHNPHGDWKTELRALKWCGPKTYSHILEAVGEAPPIEAEGIQQRAGDVSLMLWAMKKIGCIDRIRRAYVIALEACRGTS